MELLSALPALVLKRACADRAAAVVEYVISVHVESEN